MWASLGPQEAGQGGFGYSGKSAADVPLLRQRLLERGAEARKEGEMSNRDKTDREGAIAPLRRERQAFLDAFMSHAESFVEKGMQYVMRARLRMLLSDAWYDGYIAG